MNISAPISAAQQLSKRGFISLYFHSPFTRAVNYIPFMGTDFGVNPIFFQAFLAAEITPSFPLSSPTCTSGT